MKLISFGGSSNIHFISCRRNADIVDTQQAQPSACEMALLLLTVLWHVCTNVRRLHSPRNAAVLTALVFCRGNQVLSEKVASSVPVAASFCRLWYTWRLVAGQAMLVAVEALLIIRGAFIAAPKALTSAIHKFHVVYALYSKSKRIVLCLVALVLAEVVCSATNSTINIPRLIFSPTCSTVLELRPIIQFGCVPSVLCVLPFGYLGAAYSMSNLSYLITIPGSYLYVRRPASFF